MYNPASTTRYAIEMELLGYNFHKEDAEGTENPIAEKILQRLAKIELSHYEYLKKLLKGYEDTSEVSGKTDTSREENIIFKTRKESEKLDAASEQSMIPDINVLRMAYLIEEDFEQYCTNMVEKVEDEKLKEILFKLVGWENGHAKLLKAQYQKRMDQYMSMSWGG